MNGRSLRRRCFPQRIAEVHHLRQAREIPILLKRIRRLVIAIVHIILGLRLAPRQIVAFELQAFADRERRNPNARQTEMIRPVVMSRLRVRVGLNRQIKFLAIFCTVG